jgi:hypothetical protein
VLLEDLDPLSEIVDLLLVVQVLLLMVQGGPEASSVVPSTIETIYKTSALCCKDDDLRTH